MNSFEAQLLERISIMNSKLEANIASISNSSNTTNLLVKKMLDNNDIMMEGNAKRDERIDLIEAGMKKNDENILLLNIQNTADVTKITRVLTDLYNQVNEEPVTFEEWEYSDTSSCLHDLLQHSGKKPKESQSGKRKKTMEKRLHKRDMDTIMETAPASMSGLSGVEEE